MKYFNWICYLLILLVISCHNNSNKEKLILEKVSLNPELIENGDDTLKSDDYLKGFRVYPNSTDSSNPYFYFIDSRKDTAFYRTDFKNKKIEKLYTFTPEEYVKVEGFSVLDDTFYFYLFDDKNILIVYNDWKTIRKIKLEENLFAKISCFSNPFDINDGYLYLNVGENNRTTFIGLYSDMKMPLLDTNNVKERTMYLGQFPEKFKEKEFYFRNSLRFLPQNIFIIHLKKVIQLYNTIKKQVNW